jgi:hypothetical protein
MSVSCGEHPSPFIVELGRFSVDKIGNILKPPWHGGMQPPEETGPRWQQQGCVANWA